MNDLKVVSINGQLVTDSRDVAVMVNQQHKELLRTIRGYIGVLTGADLRSSDFFIPHTYMDAKKEIRPCFFLTKKGCDMVANKLTGEKGILFTAEYVTRFEEMEKSLNAPRVLTEQEQLEASMKLTLMNSNEVKELKVEVSEIRGMVENQITLDHGEQRGLQRAVARKIYELEKHPQLRPKLFRELYREIKDRFGVASYKDVKRQELQSAIGYVNAWIPKRTA
ncbi:Rha family transcriptional regulator [Sporosarcina sp. FSL K6-1508]|uniref:Rha family transcriptional regulator n=1 Tax=Sporosarcina sp. FSL K6-1508 TaxID=2921553 RepID=UPI0030F796EA